MPKVKAYIKQIKKDNQENLKPKDSNKKSS